MPYNKSMNEKQTAEQTIRPTKKQRELLTFIENFINEHGYSPSYREIMKGMNYNSVATVALHVNSLIKRGHLTRRDHSARSLELTKAGEQPAKLSTNQIRPGEEKWLVEKVDYFFHQAEQLAKPEQAHIDQLYVLVGSLKVLGLDGAAQSFIARLSKLRQDTGAEQAE